MKDNLKISIITSVYNNKETIAEAIASVLSQTYDNIEYIVVDGASTDGTIEVINAYADKITTFVSEPDNGIYDGLNKGISLATGDVVGFLHSDDLFASKDVISNIVNAMQRKDVDAVYGDLVYVNQAATSKVIRYWKSEVFNHKKLENGWMPPHPTFYVKREVYQKHGNFDTQFKIAADYDIILRFLGREGISCSYIPKILVKMRVGGASNRSLSNMVLKTKEDFLALRRNNIGHLGTVMLKNLSKIKQFFVRAP